MNGNSVLLDTNIVLYLLSGDEVLSDLLYNRKLYISFVTQLELLGYQGITKKEEQEVKHFLEDCIIIDINNQIKEEVIHLKQSRKIKLPDSIILATSKYLNIPVISSDSDFSKVEEVNVIYYEKE
ncbi:type II toxin-antitoxin system VapC family toxin [Fulvivirga sp. M361]|uniref:type II toxin-antitoxin system VapC family toxin n=1 Tax=Fulvivirga sp. M361 TaxID=2594266 RepID=UPI00117AE9B1|nr:type II toxin-antitoxin system VapC family toxin [Fulvivirga sp. M361]TRX50876.1 type II toxin-antitoxin system VapC family toxin [Fulvivirga sp. M361]